MKAQKGTPPTLPQQRQKTQLVELINEKIHMQHTF
jgi:hypothetical protein